MAAPLPYVPPSPALEVRAEINAFLAREVPDIYARLLTYTVVLATCPGCGVRTVFFDPRGMNMVPTWSALVERRSEVHPWECRCSACGWHAVRPPDGETLTLHGNGFWRSQTMQEFKVALPPSRRVETSSERFWWQDD